MADKTEETNSAKSSVPVRPTPLVSYFACTICKEKFHMASANPVCIACRPANTPVTTHDTAPDSELVHALFLSLSGLQNLAHILEMLSKGLALSSLKVQVSALSILYQQKIALRSKVRTFPQGETRLVPPYKHPVPQ
ncbi:hypothetical protein XELAEV_18041984mg [Xenopus laevis]|uniref:Uncharacterized protein n=1 Tax=Xenopus laevis TaxID=8355 RepID=A0A974C3E1_XENLA|nr:hypothetical protein XELAEV_18041984mg [Xenopus laevis]